MFPTDDLHHINGGVRRPRVAIAFADIVGYSLLMAADEDGTYRRWMAMLRDVVRPAAERRSGRIVDLAGDGVLAQFVTADDAVAWARDLQGSIRRTHEAEGAAAALLALRIGVHVGEVFVSEGRIFGDAVNLAARLQEHAQPGGIVVSDAASDALGADARDLGDLDLRHIKRPVHAFSIDADVVRVALPLPRPPEHALPSIAVLPLHNVGGASGDDYFADGIVEDITVSLAASREVFVIAHSSTLGFRGANPDIRQIGRALGVRYILTGSLRRSRQTLRVSFQLSDARTAATIWGDRMDIDSGDLFAMQDEVTIKVLGGIAPNVRAAEIRAMLRKRPESFTAYDSTLRALHGLHFLDRNTWAAGRELLYRAMSEDPDFAMPVAWAAWWYSLWIGQGWSTDVAGDTERALALAVRSNALDERNALGLAMQGHLLAYLRHEPDAALTYFEQALAACPNSALAWMYSSNAFSYLGRGEEALSRARYALRLSPHDQRRFLFFSRLGLANYVMESYDESIRWMRLSLAECPTYTTAMKVLAASLAAQQRFEEAREVANLLRSTEPSFRLDQYERQRGPFKNPARMRFIGHLREVGLD
jgi:adenylate cyclase